MCSHFFHRTTTEETPNTNHIVLALVFLVLWCATPVPYEVSSSTKVWVFQMCPFNSHTDQSQDSTELTSNLGSLSTSRDFLSTVETDLWMTYVL